MLRPLCTALPLVLTLATACAGDETLRAYGAGDKTWMLQTIDDAPFPAKASISFPEPGRIAGKAPCNSFSGAMSAPYPWFETGALISTRMACPNMAPELAFFQALAEMTQAEVLGDTMILRDDAGREMVFKAAE